MISYRKDHLVIRKKLPDAVCGMDSIHTHNVNAQDISIPRDAYTFAVSFAGYDREKEKMILYILRLIPTGKMFPSHFLIFTNVDSGI